MPPPTPALGDLFLLVYVLLSTTFPPPGSDLRFAGTPKLADTHSKKRIELGAVGLFLAGSFLCGLAGEFGPLPVLGDGMNQLIAFRAVQGLGGAGLFAMAFIVIADLFPPRERGTYQGFVGATFGIASVLGPVVGGFLTDHGGGLVPGIAGWRWVFYVNVPFGAVALWFILRRMPALEPRARGGGLDYLGAALLLAGLVPLVLGLQLDKQAHPWTAPETLALFAGSVLALALFAVRSLRVDSPVLDLRLFQVRGYRRNCAWRRCYNPCPSLPVSSFLYGSSPYVFQRRVPRLTSPAF